MTTHPTLAKVNDALTADALRVTAARHGHRQGTVSFQDLQQVEQAARTAAVGHAKTLRRAMNATRLSDDDHQVARALLWHAQHGLDK